MVEVIFSLPGIGTLLSEAINARQYIALQSLVAIIAVGYVLSTSWSTSSTPCSTRGSAMPERDLDAPDCRRR